MYGELRALPQTDVLGDERGLGRGMVETGGLEQ